MRKTPLALIALISLAGCAAYSGIGLKPGISTESDVIQTMGQAHMRWQEPDGSHRLAFPRGPMGTHTYMAEFDAKGKLQHMENVLTPKGFSRIQAGMNKEDVLKVLGPPEPSWTMYFKARDELAWEWRYCDDWNELARFDVLFDNTTGIVRSTLSLTESQMGKCGEGASCLCGH